MKKGNVLGKNGGLVIALLIEVIMCIAAVLSIWAAGRSIGGRTWRIHHCLNGVIIPPAATQTAIAATYTPPPVCATEYAQDTAEARAANPLWWLSDH